MLTCLEVLSRHRSVELARHVVDDVQGAIASVEYCLASCGIPSHLVSSDSVRLRSGSQRIRSGVKPQLADAMGQASRAYFVEH